MTTAQEWETIGSIYDEAIKLTGSEQYEFIIAHTNKNSHIVEQVMKMLEVNKSQGFMGEFPGKIALDNIDLFTPEQLGHFRILKKIATGGMGRVYLAQSIRADVTIKVALKTIRIELINDELKQKFQNEKNILSKLQHKNIASLIDAGITDENIPYIATEWVDGQNIQKFCELNNLSIKQRLKLFLQICDAMIFAHNKMIIHRDLKPDNILVNNHKQVKLLDFGIAKIIDANQSAQTQSMQTQIFTPDYAAPEQLNGQMCSAATDIYSLGIILFEMLTHSKRFNLLGLAITEKIKAIAIPKQADLSDVQPDKPLPYSISQLKGPLYNIINKAIHVEPNRRYDSVASLVSDVESYLGNRPVKAMRDSVFYKTQMLFKRNKLASGFLALAFISISLGLFIANKQLLLKQKEAEKTKIMLEFFQDILKTASPNQGGSINISVREMFEKGIENYSLNSINDPYIRAEISVQMGNIYSQLGNFKKGMELLENAVYYFESNLTSSEYANNYLSYVHRIIRLKSKNEKTEDAINLLESAIDNTKEFSVSDKLIVRNFTYLGYLYHEIDNKKSLNYLKIAEQIGNNKKLYFELGFLYRIKYYLNISKLSYKGGLHYLNLAQENLSKVKLKSAKILELDLIISKANLNSKFGHLKTASLNFEKAQVMQNKLFGHDDYDLLLFQAKNNYKLGSYEKALTLIEQAEKSYLRNQLTKGRRYHEIILQKARIYTKNLKLSEAEKLLTVVENFNQTDDSLNNSHVILRNAKSNLYFHLEDKKKMKDLLNSYSKFNQSSFLDMQGLGYAHLLLGNYSLSEKYLIFATKSDSGLQNERASSWEVKTALEFSRIQQGKREFIESFETVKEQLLNRANPNEWYNNFYTAIIPK